MSVEDDTDNGELELKELLTQTLDENGLLSQIRAQLRAGLYLALETDINKTDQQSHFHGSLKSKLSMPEIKTIFCLVREFLEYFDLKFTANIFEKESLLGTAYTYNGREKLIQELDLGIDSNTLHNSSPLLLEILNVARNSFNLSVRNNMNNETYEVSNQSIATSDHSQHYIEVKTVPKESQRDEEQNELDLKLDSTTAADENGSESSIPESMIVEEEQSKCDTNTHSSKIYRFTTEEDDTYEGTSSLAEDSVKQTLIDFDRSIKIPQTVTTPTKTIIDQTILDDTPKSPRLSFSPEHNKKHDKSDRKPMSGLSSLADLPPLHKPRNTDTVLLPSLYSKDFRDKLKDDEDSEKLLRSSPDNKSPKSSESKSLNISSKNSFDSKKSVHKNHQNIDNKLLDNEINMNTKLESTESSISEDIDLNSNIDEFFDI